MGMHEGYLVATAAPARLLAELSRHAGEFTTGEVVACAGADLDSGQFELLLGGDDDHAYLLDTSMVLSNSPDLIVTLSAALGTVVGAGAETLSGGYWLMVARDGSPLRYVFASYADMSLGMMIGEPVASEAEHPVDEDFGDGVWAALAAFDLDPRPWLRTGSGTIVRWDATRMPVDGPIDGIRREHRERYRRDTDPEQWLRGITAVSRPPQDGG